MGHLAVLVAMGGVGVCQLRVPMDDDVVAMAVMMVVVMVMRTGGRDCRRAKQHDGDRGGEPDHYEPRSLLASVGWFLLCGLNGPRRDSTSRTKKRLHTQSTLSLK